MQEAVVTLGCDVDWSRTLRTDDEDLLYRSFVEWQVFSTPSLEPNFESD
jgi:leucyl-tRNA synthetase